VAPKAKSGCLIVAIGQICEMRANSASDLSELAQITAMITQLLSPNGTFQ